MSSVTESPFSVNDFMDLLGDDSPTELTMGTSDRKERKKARHRKEMIEFRLNKKDKQKKLLAEHQRLERDMKTLVGTMKETAASSGGSLNALQELVVERESLRNENLALHEELKRYEKFKAVVLEASQDPMEREESNLLPASDDGWRVTLGEEEESFYFHPFTRGQVDAEMKRFEDELMDAVASLSMAGTFFGWKVYRAPLVASVLDSSRLIARTRVTKRLRCSLDVHTQMSYTKQKDISPMIITPIGWGLHHRGETSTQVLQEFDQDSIVFVHNVPGPERSLRYLFQVRRAQWKLLNGRRKLTASLAIIDSDANRRSRDASNSHRVQWATEGGIQVSITEVDEDSIDVTCDHWASCESTQHAEFMMIQWTQFAIWWEQLTVPSNLLLNTCLNFD